MASTNEITMSVKVRRQVEVGNALWAALFGLCALFVAYLFLLPEALQSTFDYYVIEPTLLTVLLALYISASLKADTENRKWFWRLISASFGFWLASAAVALIFRDENSTSLTLLRDLLYLGHFCLVAAAVELRLDKGDGQRRAKQHAAAAFGSLLMFVAIFLYFGIAPLANSSGPYAMPYGLHAAFDVYLAFRFLLAVFQTDNPSWRFLFGGFATVFSLIVVADLLAMAFDSGIIDYAPGQPVNLLWYAWYPVAFLLSGTRLTPSAEEPGDDPADRLTVASRALLLFGLSLPFLHVTGYAMDLLDVDARRSRDFVVGIWIVIITLMLVVLYFLFRGRVKKLDNQRKHASARARRVEEQLDRELRIRSLGRLSAGLAHDFGNTLTAITLHADLIRNKLARDHSVADEFDGLDEGLTYARSLVDKLAQFGNSGERIVTGNLELNFEVRNTVEVIQHALSRSVQLVLQEHDTRIVVRADKTMIHQVVSNYVYNAIDAVSNDGDIEVSIDLAQGFRNCASCGEHFSGHFARLAVRDSGAGIDATLADRIFEPLVSSKPVGVGSGLGLSTVHGIMHSIGGHVGVTQETGTGTCFFAYFPVAASVG